MDTKVFFFFDNLANFQLKLVILVYFVKFGKIGSSSTGVIWGNSGKIFMFTTKLNAMFRSYMTYMCISMQLAYKTSDIMSCGLRITCTLQKSAGFVSFQRPSGFRFHCDFINKPINYVL